VAVKTVAGVGDGIQGFGPQHAEHPAPIVRGESSIRTVPLMDDLYSHGPIADGYNA